VSACTDYRIRIMVTVWPKTFVWKEVIGKVHTQSKEEAAQYFVRHTQTYLCHRQRSALAAEQHFVGGSLPMARQPGGVSRSTCSFFRITSRKDSG
jgi:hypothetical protein